MEITTGISVADLFGQTGFFRERIPVCILADRFLVPVP